MPASGAVLALPPLQLPPEEAEEVEVDNGEKGKPASMATQTRTTGLIDPPPDRNSWLGTFGKNFLKGLTNREHSSPQFYFLEPMLKSCLRWYTSICARWKETITGIGG
ncbi:unnamed protein product [Calypogeia fissa]